MDNYIKDFTFNDIKTEHVANFIESNYVFSINNNTTNFKLFHTNIRSVRKNFEELQTNLSQHIDFECIILTETFILDNPDLYYLEGYDLTYNCANLNRNDGIIMYVKKSIPHTSNIVKLTNVTLLHSILHFSNKTISIIAIYRSPSGDTNIFMNDLREYLNNEKRIFDYSFIVGDINIDLTEKSSQVEEYVSTLNTFGYLSLINEPTRSMGDSHTCIDHIFMKTDLDSYELCLPLIIHSCITDHFSTAMQLVVTNEPYVIQNRKRYVEYINYRKLKAKLEEINWENVYVSRSVELSANTFTRLVEC